MADSTKPNSRIAGMRDLSPFDRRHALAQASGLGGADITALAGPNSLPTETANGMIENVIGTFELPLGIATNFTINGRDYLIPMAVEEPSVVAAASYMARIVGDHGGFQTSSTLPIMRGQIQVLGTTDPEAAKSRLLAAKQDLIAAANACNPILVDLGGGCVGIEVHMFNDTPVGLMVVLHILVDLRDAMGANAVNSMAEALAPNVALITGGEMRLRILSNLADFRLARAQIDLPPNALDADALKGGDVAKGIVLRLARLPRSIPTAPPPITKVS